MNIYHQISVRTAVKVIDVVRDPIYIMVKDNPINNYSYNMYPVVKAIKLNIATFIDNHEY
jgi:hypothetical protein